ncbi:MAG: hypothetical protein H0X34_10890 [Chthoniobacterales bacterium]|nr:hypothetical protein [Chthoniobacterales bacterium]
MQPLRGEGWSRNAREPALTRNLQGALHQPGDPTLVESGLLVIPSHR